MTKRQVPNFDDIEQHIEDDDHAGWCTSCGEWTHDFCEPDARFYECPVCSESTCFGAEELLVQGLFSMEDDE